MYWPALRPFGRGKTEVATAEDDPFGSFRREMDRLFDSFGREFGWPASGRAGVLAPSIDVSETDNEIRIEAELPGVEQKDVEVVVADNLLTIKGEKKSEKEEKKKDYHLVERSYGGFARSITLPFAAEPDKAKASFKNGVLTITLPKPPEVKAKSRKIAVQAA
jgi:HSP20 family protein